MQIIVIAMCYHFTHIILGILVKLELIEGKKRLLPEKLDWFL